MAIKGASIKYHEGRLATAINLYIAKGLVKKDWEIIAIDPVKGTFILKRFEYEEEEKDVLDTDDD